MTTYFEEVDENIKKGRLIGKEQERVEQALRGHKKHLAWLRSLNRTQEIKDMIKIEKSKIRDCKKALRYIHEIWN